MIRIELTAEEEQELKRLHRCEKNKRKADRLKTILLLAKGFTQVQVSELLLLDEDSTRSYAKRFQNRGNLSDWYQDNYKPYVGKVSYWVISRIRKYVSIFMVGDKKQLLNYIKSSFGASYSTSGIQKLLKRIGVSFKKLHRLPGKANLPRQQEFVKQFEDFICSLPDKETVLFMDGVHPLHNSVCSKVWTLKGVPKWIQSNTGRERLNINGTYNYFNQDVTYRIDPSINGESTIKLLQQVSDKYQHMNKVYVFCDNARANKCKSVQKWIDSQDKIALWYLPPYSPNLNLIERLWKYFRKEVLHTKFYPVFDDFENAALNFFENIDKHKGQLAKFIGKKFQMFKPELN